MKVPKSDTKQQPAVIVRFETGPVSPAQRQAWRRFWQKMIDETKSEAINE